MWTTESTGLSVLMSIPDSVPKILCDLEPLSYSLWISVSLSTKWGRELNQMTSKAHLSFGNIVKLSVHW